MKRSSVYGESLDYFYWKFKFNTSDNAFNALLKRLDASGLTLKNHGQVRRYLRSMLGIKMCKYDSCIQNCMAFTGKHRLRRKCLYCREARFYEGDQAIDNIEEFYNDIYEMAPLTPKAQYSYLPLIPRLRLLYANKIYATKMRYPESLNARPWSDGVRDVWEGSAMREYKESGTHNSLSIIDCLIDYFKDAYTVALHFSTDGVQLFRNSTKEVWPFLVINLNLSPEERYIL